MSEPAPELKWTVKLWEEDPRKLYAIGFVALVAAVLGALLIHPILGSLLGPLLILGATSDFWLPQYFTLNGTSATRRCGISVTSVEWSAVKRVYEVAGGVKVSPLEKETRTEPFRGVLLLFNSNREEVLGAVERLREEYVRPLEGGADGI